jgi:hypothetical protein
MATNSRLQTLVQNLIRRDTTVSILYLGLLLLLARYLLSPWFGFYEDDYTLVVRGMASTWEETWSFISNLFLTFGGQGRPMQHSLLFFISRMVGQFGGLNLGYLVAYCIVLLNCSLFYILVRKLVSHEFALLSATFYTLYSADTTQAFLYHAFGLQQSLTFFLLAGLAYVSKKRVLPYLLIMGSLLSYENTYFVYLAFPLLCLRWNRKLLRSMTVHAVVLVFIFLIVVALRLATGESRAASLSWPAILTTPLLHMIQGPIVALGTNFLRPIQALQSLDPAVYALSGFAFLAFFWLTLKAIRRASAQQEIGDEAETMGGAMNIRIGGLKLNVPAKRATYLRIIIAGLLMVILAYPLTFTIRAYAISGRDTRVHFAAALGYALFWSGLWWSLISFLRSAPIRRVLIGLLSANLALLLGFGIVIQYDYARAWQLQQTLWRSILVTVPDLEDGISIFIDPGGLEDSRYIDANTWALPRVLPYIFSLPETWRDPPGVYRMLPDWKEHMVVNDGELSVRDFTWTYVTNDLDQVVLLTTKNNGIDSRLTSLEFEGNLYDLRLTSNDRSQLECGYLYKMIIDSDVCGTVSLQP